MELEQRIIIRFLYREHAEPRDIHARLSAHFSDPACSLRSVQRWCQYIRQGRELLDDEPRSGRPTIDFLDIQVLSSLERQPFHSAYSLANILDVLNTTIFDHLSDSLGMKLFHLHWIPNQLTKQLRASKIQKFQESLPLIERMEPNKSRDMLTDDEIWFMLECQHAVKGSLSRDDVGEKVRQQIGRKKFLLIVIWGVDGFNGVDMMALQYSFDSEYFSSHVLVPMVPKDFPRGRIPHVCRLHLPLDNYGVHFSKATEQFIAENHIGRVYHPLYSPDLAPSDFLLFGHLKTSFIGQTLDEPEQPLDQSPSFGMRFSRHKWLIHWVERMRWVLENNGDSYQE